MNCRQITEESLQRELNIIFDSYMNIYDEYYDTCSRDSAFLKDLTDAILGISSVLEVYSRDKEISPYYVIEKLDYSKYIINSVENFYKSKMKDNN